MEIIVTVLLVIIGITILCFLLVCGISYIENRKLTTTYYDVTSSKIPKEFEGYRIAFLTDLHSSQFGENNEQLLLELNQQTPDCVVIGGDLFVANPGQEVKTAANLVNSLCEKYPVYYGLGNHEHRTKLYPNIYGTMWEQYISLLSDHVQFLVNEKQYLERDGARIALYGLDLAAEYYRRFTLQPMEEDYLHSILGDVNEEEYSIMIGHNPDYFPRYAQWGADLVLAGHIHGGLVRLPIIGGLLSPMVRFFPKYDKGRYHIGQSEMILSGGLGNHTFKFRVCNIPELVLLELHT